MPPPKLTALPFPMKGLDESKAHREQPEGTTPDALNVRPLDALDQRMRGGQRPGLTKYLAAAVNGSNAIQGIGQVTTAFDPADLVLDTLLASDDFSTISNGILDVQDATNWPNGYYSYQNLVGDGEYNWFAYETVGAHVAKGLAVASNIIDSGDQRSCCLYKAISGLGDNYSIKVTGNAAAPYGTDNTFGIIFRAAYPTAFQCYAIEFLPAGASLVHYYVYQYSGQTTRTLIGSETSVTLPGGKTWSDDIVMEVRVSATTATVYIDGIRQAQYACTSYTSNGRVGFGGGNFDNSFTGNVTKFEVWSAVAPESLRETYLVTVSGGNVYSGSGGAIDIATGGTASQAATGNVKMQEMLGDMYFCDGSAGGYNVLDPQTNALTNWEATSNILPVGPEGTSYAITAATPATPSFTVAEDLSALSDGDYIVVTGSTANDGTYTVASTSGSGPTVITVDQTVADNTADGNVQLGTAACRIICLYRGRLVMSGLYTDPQNWFMSAVNDALDWDYSPATTTQTQAVAGNASDAGKMGDVVTALAPFSDDLLIIGGDHTIWIMRGDPAAGGVIDNVSYQTGIAGSEAWTYDPANVFYFFGAGQLWRMDPTNPTPESISAGRMDKTFDELNYATHRIRLLWDRDRDGLHIFVTPGTQAATTHYYWDRGSDSFWKDQFPAAQGPTAVWNYDADDPDDRAVLLGGFDSYIRYVDDTNKDDDGTAINSYVDLTPLTAGDMMELKVTQTRAVLASDSDAVRLEVYTGYSVEDVVGSTSPRFTKDLAAGRNAPMYQRACGNAIMFRLENDDSVNSYSWALESLVCIITLAGQQRKRA